MMKYTYKFEEMIDSRREVILNLEKTINEQKRLVDVLKKHDESETDEKNKFTELITGIEEKVKEVDSKVKELKQQNDCTEMLVLNLKKADKNTCKLIEAVLFEIGVFRDVDQPEQNKGK